MALPLIAAGVAARAVAKKLATRAAGGIVGKGAKSVNPVYRNTPPQDNVLIKNQFQGNKAVTTAVSKQILRRAKEEAKPSKAEAKANARGLKAANKPKRSK
jgi:hypothetical protein